MLLISRFMDLWKILTFDWLTVISILFDIQLPSSAPNTFFYFSNHQRLFFFFFFLLFHFYHLSFNNIMMEAISSQNMTDPIGFPT